MVKVNTGNAPKNEKQKNKVKQKKYIKKRKTTIIMTLFLKFVLFSSTRSFWVVLFSIPFPCEWWCLLPLSFGGAISMIGLRVVLGTDHCSKKKRVTMRAKTGEKKNRFWESAKEVEVLRNRAKKRREEEFKRKNNEVESLRFQRL